MKIYLLILVRIEPYKFRNSECKLVFHSLVKNEVHNKKTYFEDLYKKSMDYDLDDIPDYLVHPHAYKYERLDDYSYIYEIVDFDFIYPSF